MHVNHMYKNAVTFAAPRDCVSRDTSLCHFGNIFAFPLQSPHLPLILESSPYFTSGQFLLISASSATHSPSSLWNKALLLQSYPALSLFLHRRHGILPFTPLLPFSGRRHWEPDHRTDRRLHLFPFTTAPYSTRALASLHMHRPRKVPQLHPNNKFLRDSARNDVRHLAARLSRPADSPKMSFRRSPQGLSGIVRGEKEAKEGRRARRPCLKSDRRSACQGRSHKRYFWISLRLWARSSRFVPNGRHTMGSQERRPFLHPRSKLRPVACLDRDAKILDHVALARRPRNNHGSANEHRSLLRCATARAIPDKVERGFARRNGRAINTWSWELGISTLYDTHHPRHRYTLLSILEAP